METLDYQESKPPDQFSRWLKRIGFWFLILIAIVVAAAALRIGVALHQMNQAIRKFDESTSEAKLMGKTPQQIIALLGKPYVDTRVDGGTGINHHDTDDNCLLAYTQMGEICRIEIGNGVATKVEHYGK